MKRQELSIEDGLRNISVVMWGEESDKVYLFVHGKMGQREEAEAFAEIVVPKGWQVLSFDLPEHGQRKAEKNRFNPWCVIPELHCIMSYVKTKWGNVALYANSIGAWFSLLAFKEFEFEKCLFVSPIIDMKRLIENMMLWADVSEGILQREKEIPTYFGETLSWEYLVFARAHPIRHWPSPTAILYADKDNLTEKSTVDSFVSLFGCTLDVMENGEHWLHTPEQLAVLHAWTEKLA